MKVAKAPRLACQPNRPWPCTIPFGACNMRNSSLAVQIIIFATSEMQNSASNIGLNIVCTSGEPPHVDTKIVPIL